MKIIRKYMEVSKMIKLNHIKTKLINEEINFLLEMKKYLGIPIYVYGSLFRIDYFPNKSDIDVAIFSSNIESTVVQLINFLEISNSKVKIFKKKVTDKVTHKTKIVWGFKTNYKLDIPVYTKSYLFYPKMFKRFEISIYNKKHKKNIIPNIVVHFSLPLMPSLLIYFLKIFYYYFFFNEQLYKLIKRNILDVTQPYVDNITIIGTL